MKKETTATTATYLASKQYVFVALVEHLIQWKFTNWNENKWIKAELCGISHFEKEFKIEYT